LTSRLDQNKVILRQIYKTIYLTAIPYPEKLCARMTNIC